MASPRGKLSNEVRLMRNAGENLATSHMFQTYSGKSVHAIPHPSRLLPCHLPRGEGFDYIYKNL